MYGNITKLIKAVKILHSIIFFLFTVLNIGANIKLMINAVHPEEDKIIPISKLEYENS
jgi:hypothetical protein|uniref:Uncharacterized protein n=1 Tax=Staphylococcus aureus TaxID=1280 RepID=A0A385EKR7_STAAU|nr:hypothetical protein [Staphylococcus aureus]AXQ85850.1 hypothetical protein pWBG731_00059 [Staphylococcus aureus]